ncbi:cytochrome bd-I ubiquinol oxidase subunit 2 apoprotein [Chitinophaga costaii]|uniref:Cytochrome bd-I ubiquinol oxidase subunit 2 apoprotein n=1 Tax=Chitinophaga costaii TaxID=1335309 RepID=A0A1C4FLL0_9BACT|nr:cytochrome d ubiquinol oxidase subunit II [Chitinophaga costaii]PUZ29967.1 cytochrome d ubiquinol oxidase subunit II [Chitinophaga costaii]SCC56782.1 cytochrome bd-I ubiquinol oxidase subunit 2 apoprotein [Chitinophaga costaii]
MLYVVIVFLWTSILLYLLLGGADFGAGIIELFTSKHNQDNTRKTMYRAIGPIWEANHMWLIIAIVILFVGFPEIYTTMSIYLHIPLVIMLMGIIARGTAFSFRNYDAVVDDMQLIYNRIFRYASCVTPFFLGIIAGSAVAGRIDTHATNFLDAYVFSWLHWFSVAIGLFTVAICGFLAAVYLIGETDNEKDRQRFIAKARTSNILAVIAGALVFVAAWVEHIPLIQWVFGNVVGITAIGLASLSLLLLWYLLYHGKTKILRILAGFQVTMILLTTTYRHFPNIVLLKGGAYLSLLDNAGNAKTMAALGWALLLGSVFILPALFYLIYSFQKKKSSVAH